MNYRKSQEEYTGIFQKLQLERSPLQQRPRSSPLLPPLHLLLTATFSGQQPGPGFALLSLLCLLQALTGNGWRLERCFQGDTSRHHHLLTAGPPASELSFLRLQMWTVQSITVMLKSHHEYLCLSLALLFQLKPLPFSNSYRTQSTDQISISLYYCLCHNNQYSAQCIVYKQNH